MDNFQIETAQNINIRQNSAGIGERIGAFFIDIFIIGIYSLISGLVISGTGLKGVGMWVYYLVLGLPALLYFLIWETFWDGQSPGKAALKIRVVMEDGSRPAFSNYLIRWLLRFIDISLSSGAIAVVVILLNGKGQRLGDIAAKTSVISEKNTLGLENTLAVDLPENYQPTYPQVSVLEDKEVQEIKNIFQTAKKNGEHQVILALSKKIEEILQIKSSQRPVDFIQTIIWDYNYYTRM